MSNEGAQLIFGELVERHGRIRVPLIQRDYAQGRADQEEVREDFLAALQEALQLAPDSERLPLNLDFIYGSVEGGGPSSFQPLDGQQRLTTLFLLHWYLAWRDQVSSDFQTLCSEQGTSRFSYQVRPSSKEFFDALVSFVPDLAPEEVTKVGEMLEDQPWYYRSWRLDPTIQSALVMLDAIHVRFVNTQSLYARLTDTDHPAITFQLLDLINFGLSDDLYIKMNARGKPLTPFETFKARYEQILRDLFPEDQMQIDGQSVSVADYFARRMDTKWADFFWPHRDPDTHVFDDAVMNVFRTVILITRSPESDQFVKDITDLRSKSQKSGYHFFQQREWLDVPFSKMLITLLDTWSGVSGTLIPQLPDKRYFDEAHLLGEILDDPTGLGYDEIVQYAAYAQFLAANENSVDPNAFQEWMRVVFNLSTNTEYNRPGDMQRSFAALGELTPHMNSILEYLADEQNDVKAFSREQLKEERIKARLLLADDDWRQLIDRAEGHGYFVGQIGFLLNFSGISAHPASDGEQDWTQTESGQFKVIFEDFLAKAESMFDQRGLKSLPEYRWERALLSLGDYLLPSRRNHSFLINLQSDQASWKRLLRDSASGTSQGKVLKALWDSLDIKAAIPLQLDKLIASAKNLEDWRQALVENPAAIQYCAKRMIRHAENQVTYLLSKVQLNGAHAELFTYCLHLTFLRKAEEDGRLETLQPSYDETYSTDDPPGIWLDATFRAARLRFFLQFHARRYLLSVHAAAPSRDALLKVLEPIGFTEDDDQIQKTCAPDSVEDEILVLDKKLTEENKDGQDE